MSRRFTWLLPLVTAVACTGTPPPARPPARAASPRLAVSDGPAPRTGPANFSALAPRRTAGLAAAPGAAAVRDPTVGAGDDGVPGFRWATAAATAAAVRSTGTSLSTRRGAVEQARAHLAGAASLYGLSARDVDEAEVVNVHDTGRGAVIVKFASRLDGIEVFRGTTALAMDRSGALIAQSGALIPASARPEGARFTLDAGDVIGRALTDLTGDGYAAGDLVPSAADQAGYARFGLAPVTGTAHAVAFPHQARAKRVWFPLPRGLEPAWYLEVGVRPAGSRDALEYGYVISARDGAVLFRRNQVQDAFTYRVYADSNPPYTPYDGPQGYAGTPHPTGEADGFQPAFVPQNDVSLDNAGFGVPAGDPWLAAGTTVTQGNNVDAYADISGADGFDGTDVRPTATGAGVFLYTFDQGATPAATTNRKAAVVNLFYLNNWLHDWYYAAGFAEADGNAQQDNKGRGGAGGDRIHAEAQDQGGTDNANMSTPADGGSPRMQMYLWSPRTAHSVVVNSPAAIAATVRGGISADFGPQSFDLTGDLVKVVDAIAPLNDGCTALTNGAALTGKIALIDRGDCTFAEKIKIAQDAGATGALIRNVDPTQAFVNMAGSGTAADAAIHIPAMLVEQVTGDAIEAQFGGGATVNVTLQRTSGLDRDGDLDGTIMAHEWAHYLSNRLIGDSTGLDTNMAGGLGEGWSDFNALLMVARPEDAGVAANAGWAGVYGMAGYSDGGQYALGGGNDSFYWGIRRVPYSIDQAKNPLTFRHIAENQAIPTEAPGGITIPVQYGQDGVGNSEVHNVGEVWATMLWECYAALLNDSGRLTFADAQDRMKRYLVASLKLTPNSPTLLEARDALFAAAYAEDPADFEVFFDAFARRGAGIGAVGPNRYRADNTPVVESYLTGAELAVGTIGTAELAGDCNDADGVLDNEETATVTVDLQNVGSKALGATTVTLSSADPRLTFPAGATAPVTATNPRGTGSAATLTFQAHLTGAYKGELIPVDLGFPTGYLRTDEPRRAWLRVNYDDVAAVSATDHFESGTLAWTTESIGTTAVFALEELDPSHHVMAGPDVGAPAEVRVTSPALLAGTGPVVVTWRHRHAFETFQAPVSDTSTVTVHGDGGVVELSSDGGTTWVDVGAQAAAAGGSIYAGSLAYPAALGTSANPLRAKTSAVVDRNPSYPEFDAVTLDLGTAYAGKSLLLRFRIGTDEAGGGDPWEIDDLAVSGISNTPFPDLVRDRNVCGTGGPVASAGADQRVLQGSPVALDASDSAAEDPAAVLTYAWTQTGGTAVTLADASTARATFTAPEVTTDTPLTFEVSVSAGGAPATASTTVTVVAGNRRPVASIAGGATQTVDEGTLVTLDGSGSSDPDAGTTLTYQWTRVSGPSVTITGAATATPRFTAPSVTSDTPLVIRLVVSDGALTGSTQVTFTVKNTANPSTSSGGGCGCGSASTAGPLALAWLAALLRRRRRT